MKTVSILLSFILPAGVLATHYSGDGIASNVEFSPTPVPVNILTATTELPTYTLDDVAKHATPDDCWLVIDRAVYDVTTYTTSPSDTGPENSHCGKDMTASWKAGHTAVDEALLPHYLIGFLDPETKY